MLDLNEVKLIGNLGKDPEVLKTSESGCLVRISLATCKRYTNAKGKPVSATHWHTIFLRNELGKFAATHLKKGSRLFIAGELQTYESKDEATAEPHYSTMVQAIKLELIAKPIKEDA